MRERTKLISSDDQVGHGEVKRFSESSQTWETATEFEITAHSEAVKHCVDTITPNFRACQKKGVLPLNPFDIRTVEEIAELGSVDFKNRNASVSWWQNHTTGAWSVYDTKTFGSIGVPPPREDLLQQLVNEAVSAARESVLDLSTSTIELRETYGMFRTYVVQLARLRKTFLKDVMRQWSKASKSQRLLGFTKFSADKWLEYRYGWLPLVLSLNSALSALNDTRGVGDAIVTRRRQTESLDDSRSGVVGPTSYRDHFEVVLRGTRTYRAYARATISDPSKVRWGQDPLVTAWELTPWSFVVDWFIDVGSYLQAVSAFGGTVDVSVSSSIKTEYEILHQAQTQFVDTSGVLFTGHRRYGNLTYRVKEYSRAPAVVRLPPLVPRLNSSRITDAVAFASRFLRKLR